MPFTYRTLRNGTLMHTVAEGICTFEETRDLRERIRADDSITEIYDNIVDLTRVEEFTISESEFVQLRDLLITNRDRLARRVALWAASDIGWFNAKTWEQVSEPIGRMYIVFSDLDSICLWLDIDDETRRQIEAY